jgi:RNA recognition motif-containing protein
MCLSMSLHIASPHIPPRFCRLSVMEDKTAGTFYDLSSGLNKFCEEFRPMYSGRSTADSDEGFSFSESQWVQPECAFEETPSDSPSLPPPPGYEPIDESINWSSWKSSTSQPPPFHLGHKLFVGALPYQITENDLYPLFCQYGEILELHIQRDYLGRSKGCAWLRYSTKEECDVSIEALHNNFYLGSMNRPMQLTYASDNAARSRTLSTSRPRAYTESVECDKKSLLGRLRLLSTASCDNPGGFDHEADYEDTVENMAANSTGPTNQNQLRISGIAESMSDSELREWVSQFGVVETLERVSPATAVVRYKFALDAKRAKETMHGVMLPGNNRPLCVNY